MRRSSLPSGPITYSIFRGTSPVNLMQFAQTTVPFYEDLSRERACYDVELLPFRLNDDTGVEDYS
jgi:hypothetical protein